LKPIVLNQSSLKDFQNCQRLYGWYRLEKIESPRRKSALEIGTAVHEGLAVFHSEGGTAEKALKIAQDKLEERSGPQLAFEDKSLEEAKNIVDNVLPAYFDHWDNQGELWAPLNVEVEFLVEVGTDTGVFLRGRADNLSTYAGGLYLVDYKTAGRMDPRDLLKYEMDIQLSSYIYGISKQLSIDSISLGGELVKVNGAIIDLLVKTKTPQFAREVFTRTDEEMREFEEEFVELGTRIRQQKQRVEDGEDWKKVFPRNTEHCFRYGTCPYRDVCAKDTEVRRAMYSDRAPDYVDIAQAELEREKGEA